MRKLAIFDELVKKEKKICYDLIKKIKIDDPH